MRSIRSNPQYKLEACRVGERPKVAVSREEGNTSGDAGLGDQGVSEVRLASLCHYLGSQDSSPLPIARFDLDHRHLRECFGNS